MRRRIAAWLVVGGLLGWGTPARADVVTDWNLIAAQAIAVAGVRQGPAGAIDVAMVQVAIHDAIQAYQHRFESYSAPIANASGSPVAAAATAAHDVLIGVGLTSTAAGTIDSIYNTYLSSRGLQNDNGIATGHQAAAQILSLRAGNDGRAPANAEQFFGGTSPGEWRPTAVIPGTSNPMPMVAAFLAHVTPFTLKDPDQFRPSPPPPHLTSGEYAQDYNEVKRLGGVVSQRTPEQTDMALFFSDNALQYWYRAARSIAAAHLSDIGDSGRLFALFGMSTADAVITAWNTKRYWNFWRPITAIHEGENDGNFKTAGDPGWQPLIVTPNYPTYVSGASTFAGAASTSLGNYFGSDKMDFTISSAVAGLTLNPRPYERFSDAADDVVSARVYEGIHFRLDDVVGAREGKHVANWAFAHFLRPLE